MKDEFEELAGGPSPRAFIHHPSAFILSDRGPSHEETVSAVSVARGCGRRKLDRASTGEACERRGWESRWLVEMRRGL